MRRREGVPARRRVLRSRGPRAYDGLGFAVKGTQDHGLSVRVSARLTGAAFYVQIPTVEKLVLLCLCDHSNDAGENVFAAIRVLAIKTGVSERTVQRTIKRLEGLGLVQTVSGGDGPGDGKRVRILRETLFREAHKGDRLSPLDSEKGVSGGGGRVTGKGDIAESPDSKTLEPTTGKAIKDSKALLSGKPDQPSLIPDRDSPRGILEHFNRKAGKHYQPLDAILRKIAARLKEATPDQIRGVISIKIRDWKDDPKMQRYLRPKTLFSAENFAAYLGELPAAAFEETGVS